MSRSKTLEQPRDDALNQGSRRAEMPGDRPKSSEREKEKAASQLQTRYFTKAQSQKRHEAGRLELDKKSVIIKGSMDRVHPINRGKTLEQPRDDALNQGSRRAKMPRDIPKFSERGKEKAASQSQPRDFTKAQAQKWHEIARLKLVKKRYILKGGMERGETSNQGKKLEQQKEDAIAKEDAISDYNDSWAHYFFKRGHRDEDRYLDDIDKIDTEHTNRVEAIQQRYEEESTKNQ
jgi:hypothetical protein